MPNLTIDDIMRAMDLAMVHTRRLPTFHAGSLLRAEHFLTQGIPMVPRLPNALGVPASLAGIPIQVDKRLPPWAFAVVSERDVQVFDLENRKGFGVLKSALALFAGQDTTDAAIYLALQMLRDPKHPAGDAPTIARKDAAQEVPWPGNAPTLPPSGRMEAGQ